MRLSTQRRLAAKILGVGVNRVWIDPERLNDVSAAITKDDIRRLIGDGAIKARPKGGVSRVRARERLVQRKKGRRRGEGSRKGSAKARVPTKRAWISRVRPLRARLRELRDGGKIDPRQYRRIYRMVKGGAFRSKAHLEAYLKEKKIIEG